MSLEHRYDVAYEQANRYDQEHIFQFWDELRTEQKLRLLGQAEALDYALIERIYRERAAQRPSTDGIKPPLITDKRSLPADITQKGEQALKEGKVAVLIVAGGQGSRLGIDGPKGVFPATPVKKKPLFQLFCERVLATKERYGSEPELYVMTSEDNHDATASFLEDHGRFGLDKDKVVLFKQEMLPAVDEDGKLLLKDKGELALAPGGTGGVYRALVRAGITRRMAEHGIDHLHYINVDNPLAVIPDPSFIGLHLQERAEVTAKVVEKTYPEERVGVFVDQEGATRLIEYIFMLEELLYQRDKEHKLAYRAGNIAIHLLSRSFVERVASDVRLPSYLAHKRVNHVDKHGDRITPLQPNAYKFESFVFDAFPEALNVVLMSVSRGDEFAPIKNAEGRDSPDSSRNLQVAQAKRWLEAAGISKGVIERLEAVEVSPLFALTEEEFVRKVKPHNEVVEKRLKGQKKAYLC
ncbi:UTP--glucose-1-phosphate uridylyltransferase [Candidatus Woesearchaeota archaeon]|nr:UTP--glucose-1-phosphate uridylyltransferase [Candidatus Woesearchaeota archaeon]